MRRLTAKLRRAGALLLLPLSTIPLVAVAPRIVDSHANYERVHNSGPLPAPAVALSPAERAGYARLPAHPDAVPVLAYHAINESHRYLSITPKEFARQMRLLRHLGYEAISIAAYQRFRAGDTAGLPARPVLITFDGGRLDAYRGADRILERERLRATMFVVTARIERKDPDHLTWRELHRMADSGRWDVQSGTHDADREVATDAIGGHASFLAARRYTRSGGKETFAGFEQRITTDIFAARKALEAQGFEPRAIAAPFGDEGRHGAEAARIVPLLSGLLTRQFGTYFVRDEANNPTYSHSGAGRVSRFEVTASVGTDQLYAWLRRRDPGAPATDSPRKKD